MQRRTDITEAWNRKYPEQVVLAITKNTEGRINLMAIGWVCVVSDDPPMFLLGIDDEAYSFELIKQNKELVIAYPSKAMAEATMYVGTVHGHNEDKGTKCGLKYSKAKCVDVPLLSDAVANFECKLKNIYQPGNCPLIVAEVIAAHVNSDENIKRLTNFGGGKLD